MLDFIIVGQGLAGSVLAFTLIRRGCKGIVLDHAKGNGASQVAAGLYNPVTGRKMVKTWKADHLFPFLENFYAQAEKETGYSFLYPQPIYRPFQDVEEQNDWMGKSSNNHFAPFVHHVAKESMFGEDIHDPYGGILLKQSGFVDLPVFIQGIRHWLQAMNSYRETLFDPQQLQIEGEAVRYQEWKARKVIFCDGTASARHHFFGWLPFRPVKGELLYIALEKPIEVIYNRGVFVLPTPQFCKVGATYDHHDLSQEITAKARTYLLEKLNILLKSKFELVGQVAGIRPATPDRRPFVGIHPAYKPMGIFNGLGTKGVSLAPYFASQLADHLLQGKALDEEVNISRYFQLYNRVIA